MAVHHVDPASLRARFPEMGDSGEQDLAVLADDSGYVHVRYLGFDSNLFGLKIGRVAMGGEGTRLEALRHAIELARAASFRQLLATVDARARVEIAALEASGFSLLDVGVTFRHSLETCPETGEVPGVTVRVATEADIEPLREVASTLFLRSRFYFDADYTRGDADELHRVWIENCVRGRADVVLLARSSGEVAGFFTCAVDEAGIGHVELVGVTPAFSGRGVGRLLTERALAWFSGRATEVRVKTQVTNFPAAALYTSSGFRLVESDLTYRISLSEASASRKAALTSETSG